MSEIAGGGAPPATGAPSVEPPTHPGQPTSKPNASRNLRKKLRHKYLDILGLEAQLAAGVPLNADQQAKLARKHEVAAQLAQLGCQPPTLSAVGPAPAPEPAGAARAAAAAAAAAAAPGLFRPVGPPKGGLRNGISEEEALAACEAMAVGERPPPPAGLPPNPRPHSQALLYQQGLREQNPGFSYFFALPPPLPDLGVTLTAPMGAIFFEIMVGRAEAGDPRAVKMMYEQLKVSGEQQGMPHMQVRVQLLAEYGIDPITERPFEGTEQEALAWVESVTPATEVSRARKAFERMVESLLMQQMMGGGGGGGGMQGRRRGGGRRGGQRR